MPYSSYSHAASFTRHRDSGYSKQRRGPESHRDPFPPAPHPSSSGQTRSVDHATSTGAWDDSPPRRKPKPDIALPPVFVAPPEVVASPEIVAPPPLAQTLLAQGADFGLARSVKPYEQLVVFQPLPKRDKDDLVRVVATLEAIAAAQAHSPFPSYPFFDPSSSSPPCASPFDERSPPHHHRSPSPAPHHLLNCSASTLRTLRYSVHARSRASSRIGRTPRPSEPERRATPLASQTESISRASRAIDQKGGLSLSEWTDQRQKTPKGRKISLQMLELDASAQVETEDEDEEGSKGRAHEEHGGQSAVRPASSRTSATKKRKVIDSSDEEDDEEASRAQPRVSTRRPREDTGGWDASPESATPPTSTRPSQHRAAMAQHAPASVSRPTPRSYSAHPLRRAATPFVTRSRASSPTPSSPSSSPLPSPSPSPPPSRKVKSKKSSRPKKAPAPKKGRKLDEVVRRPSRARFGQTPTAKRQARRRPAQASTSDLLDRTPTASRSTSSGFSRAADARGEVPSWETGGGGRSGRRPNRRPSESQKQNQQAKMEVIDLTTLDDSSS